MSVAVAEPALTGVQTPRVSWMPEGDWDWSLGDQAVVWARDVLGTYLDPWEQFCLRMMLARRPDGRWACPRFGLLVCRRNGKTHILIVRMLFGILVLGDQGAEYTAHHGKTVRATFRLAVRLLEGAGGRLGVSYRPYQSAGRESLLFDSGQELAFSTRTKSAGRGTGGDVLVVDEAQEAEDDEMDALTPILGDRSLSGNPQLIYAGSAGNFASIVFGRVRREGLSETSTRLGYLEWSIDDRAYFAADAFERERMIRSVESMAQANPALMLRREDGSAGIDLEWLVGQIDVLSPAGFAREHLGVGTWPKDDGSDWVIPRAPWQQLALPEQPGMLPSIVLAVSATWNGRAAALAAAGGMDDGRCLAWLARGDAGTSWVVPQVVALAGKNDLRAVLLDDGGPARTLADPLEQALKPLGVELVRMNARESASACGELYDAVTAEAPEFAHLGQLEVDAALAGAKKRDVGGGLWAFDRDKSETDVAPLEAVAFARRGWVIYGQADTGFNIW